MHNQRSFFTIPNFFDVTTNIFFAFIGIIGIYFTLKNNHCIARWAWFVFFGGIFTLTISSGYYHWNLMLIILYPDKKRDNKYLFMTFVLYLLAKIVEIYDKEIFSINNEMFSGHSLKHVFAAAGASCILLMLKK